MKRLRNYTVLFVLVHGQKRKCSVDSGVDKRLVTPVQMVPILVSRFKGEKEMVANIKGGFLNLPVVDIAKLKDPNKDRFREVMFYPSSRGGTLTILAALMETHGPGNYIKLGVSTAKHIPQPPQVTFPVLQEQAG